VEVPVEKKPIAPVLDPFEANHGIEKAFPHDADSSTPVPAATFFRMMEFWSILKFFDSLGVVGPGTQERRFEHSAFGI
jgi:hypothetical protein